MKRLASKLKLAMLTAAWIACSAALCCAASERGWEYQPYRIHALVAVDASGDLRTLLENELPSYLKRRAYASVGPLWSLQTELATGPARHELLSGMDSITETSALPDDADKLLLLTVRWSAEGFELRAREFDRYVQHWGGTLQARCRQLETLPEHVFQLARRSVAPLALVELDPDDETRVQLTMRGEQLLAHRPDSIRTRPGEVFLPILRRTSRDGEVVEDGIQPVPWTYIEIAERDDNLVSGQIHSGNRRPFGVRRMGRVEQIAIAARAEPADTIVRLHARDDPDKPLVGYEVFVQEEGDDDPTRLGTTNRQGKLAVPPGESAVRMLYLKNGNQVLARLPVVPGVDPQVEVPLPDDGPRLAAEARLAAIREDLIDVVARRNILMARVRQKMKAKDFPAASELLTAINELPGRAQFSLALSTAARSLTSDDPQIQRRIDQLVEGTEAVLNQFLDVRPVSELANELRAAQRAGT